MDAVLPQSSSYTLRNSNRLSLLLVISLALHILLILLFNFEFEETPIVDTGGIASFEVNLIDSVEFEAPTPMPIPETRIQPKPEIKKTLPPTSPPKPALDTQTVTESPRVVEPPKQLVAPKTDSEHIVTESKRTAREIGEQIEDKEARESFSMPLPDPRTHEAENLAEEAFEPFEAPGGEIVMKKSDLFGNQFCLELKEADPNDPVPTNLLFMTKCR